LDDLPQGLQPFVQPIDDWNTNRKLGLLFECRVGRGKLLVCAADLAKDLEHRPAARQLRASLLAYAAGAGFHPKVEVAGTNLANILKPIKLSPLAKLGAKVIASDSQADGFPAANAIDGKAGTFWHTPWGAESKPMPHHLVIDLGGEVALSGLKYLPRQDLSQGRCADCEVFCGDDPNSWGEAVASVRWEDNDQWQTLLFKKTVKARYLKLLIKSSANNSDFASVAELDIITPQP
jgi:hypothetical protein